MLLNLTQSVDNFLEVTYHKNEISNNSIKNGISLYVPKGYEGSPV